MISPGFCPIGTLPADPLALCFIVSMMYGAKQSVLTRLKARLTVLVRVW